MLWFNSVRKLILEKQIRFQYILCCGSTWYNCGIIQMNGDFNTSYVVVQLHMVGLIDHAFLNFNTSYVVVQLSWKSARIM